MKLFQRVLKRRPAAGRRRPSAWTRRAVTAVEFAIVVPIVVLLFLASVEFARFSMLRHVIDNASYEAARWVVVPGANVDEAKERALAMLDVLGVRNAEITVSPSPILETTPAVTVRIDVKTLDNQWIMPLYTGEVLARSETTLLTERVPIIQVEGVPPPPPDPPPEDPPPEDPPPEDPPPEDPPPEDPPEDPPPDPPGL
jgi:Flp pilus assembly protein TadG